MSVSTKSTLINWFNLFSAVQFRESEHTRQMTDQEVNINQGEIVFDDNNQQRKSWSCLGQTCSGSLIVCLSELFVILFIIFGCSCRIHLSITFGRINCLGGIFL